MQEVADADSERLGSVGPIGADLFKRLMRKTASSVAIITTCHDQGVHGMTCNAVCSVSAEPPTMLIVVNQSSDSHRLISRSKTFVVNILADDQRPLSERFATKSPNRFDGVKTRQGLGRSPIIEGGAAHIECKVVAQHPMGTHTIFVGLVIGGEDSESSPLVYYDRRYASIDLQRGDDRPPVEQKVSPS